MVGHDSGGLIARHAIAGDPRLRALGLIDTEQPHGSELAVQGVPRRGATCPGSARRSDGSVGRPRLRRTGLVLGGAFADARLLDGEFDEFFLRPLHGSRGRAATPRSGSCAARQPPRRRAGRDASTHRGAGATGLGRPGSVLPGRRGRAEMVDAFPDARLHVVQEAAVRPRGTAGRGRAGASPRARGHAIVDQNARRVVPRHAASVALAGCGMLSAVMAFKTSTLLARRAGPIAARTPTAAATTR